MKEDSNENNVENNAIEILKLLCDGFSMRAKLINKLLVVILVLSVFGTIAIQKESSIPFFGFTVPVNDAYLLIYFSLCILVILYTSNHCELLDIKKSIEKLEILDSPIGKTNITYRNLRDSLTHPTWHRISGLAMDKADGNPITTERSRFENFTYYFFKIFTYAIIYIWPTLVILFVFFRKMIPQQFSNSLIGNGTVQVFLLIVLLLATCFALAIGIFKDWNSFQLIRKSRMKR